MILNFANRLFRIPFNKWLYPNSSIGFGTYIGKGSNLGQNTKIGTFCSLINSKLDNNISIGSKCNLSNVTIGRFSFISENASIGLTDIGQFCSVGPQLICGRGDHPTNFASTSPVFYSTNKQCGTSFTDTDFFQERKQIKIGNDVWIGARVFIRDGLNIGNGAIIGAGAVVVKDVPDYSIVCGIPARIIRFRFPDETISKMINLQWWDWPEDILRKAQPYFVKQDIHSLIEWALKEYNK